MKARIIKLHGKMKNAHSFFFFRKQKHEKDTLKLFNFFMST